MTIQDHVNALNEYGVTVVENAIPSNIVEEINYDNFKNSISPDQSERHNSYLNVWTELRKLQK